MTRLRRFAIAALAAATVTVGSLATPPPASAAPMTCAGARLVYWAYMGTGHAYMAAGDVTAGRYWYAKAEGVIEAGC
jgi:hypothetical protein